MVWKHSTMWLCMLTLITMCALGTGSRVISTGDLMETQNTKEIDPLRLHSMDMDASDIRETQRAEGDHHKHDHMSHMAMGHMDPSLNVFLVQKDFQVGRVMPIYFPDIDPSSYPRFLPKQQADSIPFSSDKLSYLLQFFSFSKDSHQAEAMENTLRQCELPPVEGESKTCATSLESMLDFAQTVFEGRKFRAVTTIHHSKQTSIPQSYPVLRNYTILSISQVSESKMVPCHTMPYPYTVFYCHYLASKGKVFKVAVTSESGEVVDAVVVCHMDTSAWNSNHVSFSVLGIKPGTDPVCHFFPADHLVWVPIE